MFYLAPIFLSYKQVAPPWGSPHSLEISGLSASEERFLTMDFEGYVCVGLNNSGCKAMLF
jgi:hypothetical protein